MVERSEQGVDERIRQRAYRLWEEDGSPEGQADEYWYRAARQIAAEGVDTPVNGAYPEPAVQQSDKQQLETAVPEESPSVEDATERSATVSKPRAKRQRS